MTVYRGRFAPSPTGDLHLGSAATALVTWLAARAAGGELVLRIEDIDAPRVVSGVADRQLDDLRWLGLDWDEGPDAGGAFGPYRQSERGERYAAALARLEAAGLTYLCDCSRAEIARVASAPHAGDEGKRYPGTCRALGHRARDFRRPPAVRLAVAPGEIVIRDRWQGELRQDVAETVGDFVLRRGDGVWAYQLAVLVDDLAMGITEVVRGADLLSSAPRQALLARLLGGEPPAFAHAPLVLAADGTRLAKRAPGSVLRDHREAGRSPEEVVMDLARLLGLVDEGDRRRAIAASDLLRDADLGRLRGVATVSV
ncbi:MAG TPA: tRNA glutamyl-Q(34) synthetase GluQRS [Candidatus Binatia bacterium]|nr:tRNA glutamyl-Q(34) synthetase GluQRS [Candidatus Binatia bacterium]